MVSRPYRLRRGLPLRTRRAADPRQTLIGVLDLDSPLPARFDAQDQAGCEALVASSFATWAASRLADYQPRFRCAGDLFTLKKQYISVYYGLGRPAAPLSEARRRMTPRHTCSRLEGSHRDPKIALPTRTHVAPQAIAISKSADIPIDTVPSP